MNAKDRDMLVVWLEANKPDVLLEFDNYRRKRKKELEEMKGKRKTLTVERTVVRHEEFHFFKEDKINEEARLIEAKKLKKLEKKKQKEQDEMKELLALLQDPNNREMLAELTKNAERDAVLRKMDKSLQMLEAGS